MFVVEHFAPTYTIHSSFCLEVLLGREALICPLLAMRDCGSLPLSQQLCLRIRKFSFLSLNHMGQLMGSVIALKGWDGVIGHQQLEASKQIPHLGQHLRL